MGKTYEFTDRYCLKNMIEYLLLDNATFTVASTLNRIFDIVGLDNKAKLYLDSCIHLQLCKVISY